MDFSKIKRRYSGPGDNIGKELINPMLKDCVLYRRHTAWFRQSALTVWAPALKSVLDSKTKIEILVSLVGGPDEHIVNQMEALLTDDEKRDYLIAHSKNILDVAIGFENSPRTVPLRTQILRYLIANDQLEIKFAISRPVKWEAELYHKKEGYFIDSEGNKLYFNGSFNESESGLSSQGEQVTVWNSDNPSHLEDINDFVGSLDREWNAEDDFCEIVEANPNTINQIKKAVGNPKQFLETLKQSPAFVNETYDEPLDSNLETLNVPIIPEVINGKPFKLHKHQLKAYEAWKELKGTGILSHATGSGKTITAIYTASKLALANTFTTLIIQVPYQPLADQWVEELKIFNLYAIPCYRNRGIWEDKLDQAISMAGSNPKNYILPIVVVDKTFNSNRFQELLAKIDKNSLFYVCDECHRFAKSGKTSKLPESTFKLGLSGSPFNSDNHDSIGDMELKSYFGEVCHHYGLSDALADNVLTPYQYKLISCQLNDEEYEEVQAQLKIIAQNMNSDLDDEPSLAVQIASGKMNRVIGSAEDKFRQLHKVLSNNPKDTFSSSIFFCGDGSTEDDETFDEDYLIRDIDRVGKLLKKSNLTWRKFTASENTKQRNEALKAYKNNDFDALVAIRVLDEGIDVPGIKTAFLMASTSNNRQYIQRRGRILRKQEGKDYAVIYDFIIKSPEPNKSLLQKEIRRIVEIGKDCMNKEDVKDFLRDLMSENDSLKLTLEEHVLKPMESFLDR